MERPLDEPVECVARQPTRTGGCGPHATCSRGVQRLGRPASWRRHHHGMDWLARRLDKPGKRVSHGCSRGASIEPSGGFSTTGSMSTA